MKKKYCIVSNNQAELLLKDVQALLNQGWELAGGLAIDNDPSAPNTWYLQAMTFTPTLDVLNP